MEFSDVIDQLHDHHGFTDTGTAEGADFASLQKGANQVDDLNAGGQNLGACRLVHQGRCLTMNWVVFIGFDWTSLVDRISGDIEHAAHHTLADGH